MRTPSRAFVGATAVLTTAALALALGSTSSATPGAQPGSQPGANAGPGKFPGDRITAKDKDNRKGRVAPSAHQRARAAELGARARWNAFGTPAMLAGPGAPLATGLPADPAAAARAYVAANRDLLGLTESGAAALEVLTVAPMGEGAAVLFRQRFGDLRGRPSTACSSVGVRDGAVWYVSSSLARDAAAPAAADASRPTRSAIAVRDAGVADATVDAHRAGRGAHRRPGAARAAYEVIFGADLTAPTRSPTPPTSTPATATVLVREDLVDSRRDNPEWEVFPNSPPVDYSSTDTRVRWCFRPARGCDEVVGTPASPLAWDVDPATGRTSEHDDGQQRLRACTTGSATTRSPSAPSWPRRSPDRDYAYPWTNQWLAEQCCNPARRSPRRSATTSTPPGPTCSRCTTGCTTGRTTSASPRRPGTCRTTTSAGAARRTTPSRATRRPAGSAAARPAFAARDNANQITPPTAIAPITNMYLWQPIAGSFYAPVRRRRLRHVGHRPRVHPRHHQPHDRRPERRPQLAAGHERELVGPAGDGVPQRARLRAARHPRAFTIGEYVTSDPVAGIRNYNMSQSPLNYSQRRLRLRRPAGPRLRRGLERDQLRHPGGDDRPVRRGHAGAAEVVRQRRRRRSTSCPGNRRWVQLVFDSFLLMAASQVSMVDARDAMLAADMIRFGGANQDLLWNAFAKRGLGEGAVSNGAGDANPTPSFASPYANEATVTFRAGRRERPRPCRAPSCSSGDYQARARAGGRHRSGHAARPTQVQPGAGDLRVRRPGPGPRPRAGRPGHGARRAGARHLDGAACRPTSRPARAGATATGDGDQPGQADRRRRGDQLGLARQPGGRQAGDASTWPAAASQVRRVQVSAHAAPADHRRSRPRRAEPVLGAAPVPGARRARRTGAVTCADAADFQRRSSPARPTRSRRSRRGRGRRS